MAGGRNRALLVVAAVSGAAVLGLSACAPEGVPGTAPTTAPAPPSVVVHGTGQAAPFDEYELQDLQTAADQLGEPLEEVVAGQRGGKELGALADALATEDVGLVAAGHDPDRSGTAWLSFTLEPDASTMARIGALPLDTTVTWGLPLDGRDLEQYVQAAFSALEAVPGIQPISGGPTAHGDAVELRYALRDGASPPTPEALDAAVLDATRRWSTDGALRVPVLLSVGSLGEIQLLRDFGADAGVGRAP